MTSNYIRFFISSTFADMERERNLLNDVLLHLREEYAKDNWMIEWADLRWGISREAGLDNRTMRICIEELERCKKLSPRPNFIILTGERYGWIPLPEIIPFEDICQSKLESLASFDRAMFDRWYRLDFNALPAGEYVLQPRSKEYCDDRIYNMLVVKILQQILPVICIGTTADRLTRSATAHEIYAGLDADIAADTFIYRRHLTDIPEPAYGQFKETDRANIANVKAINAYIDKLCVRDNCLAINGSFEQYNSGSLDTDITKGMYDTLHRIISNVIKERTKQNMRTENEWHIALAAEHEGELAGRAEFMSMLTDYISSDDNRPLLITAKSGTGKSAVMTELINRLAKRSDIALVARLCGETPDSSKAWDFLDSINDDLSYLTEYYRRRKPVSKVRHTVARGNEGIGSSLKTYVPDIFRKKFYRPVVVVLDAIDSIDDSAAKFFFNLPWLNVELPANIKVIVSCTPDKIDADKTDKINTVTLPGLGNESMTVVNNILRRRGRTLSKRQADYIERLTAQSDTSGIYLSVLANQLAKLPSWADVSKLSSDLDGMLDMIFHTLRQPAMHGRILVDLCLRLLCTTRLGLSDNEIRDIINHDKELVDDIAGQSQHKRIAGAPAVPPIFWTRLQADLGNLIKKQHTVIGLQNRFSHSRIADYVVRHLMPNARDELKAYSSVCNYLLKKIKRHDPHALYECLFLVVKILRIANNDPVSWNKTNQSSVAALRFLLTSVNYIFGKAELFRNDLLKDYTDYSAFFADKQLLDRLAHIRNEISELPETGNASDLISYASNMPESYELNKIIRNSKAPFHPLYDVWRNKRPRLSTVHAIDYIGQQARISSDGNSIAYLGENNSSIVIERLSVNRNDNRRLKLMKGKAHTLRADDNLSVFVACSKRGVEVKRAEGGGLFWEIENADAYISNDGRYVSIFYSNAQIRYDLNTKEKISFRTSSDIVSAMPDRSGRFVWAIFDTTVVRFDLESKQKLTFNKAGRIIYVTDEICVSRTDTELYIVKHIFKDGKNSFRTVSLPTYSNQNPRIWYDDISRSLFIDFEIFVEQYLITDKIELKSDMDRQPELITVNGQYALRRSPLSIVRWKDMFDEINVAMAFNLGIGSFSASADGSVATMTFGVNEMQESYRNIIVASDSGITKQLLPFKDTSYALVTSAAVSPDGRFFAACSNIGEVIIVRRKDMTLLASKKVQPGSCLGISFTTDSRKVLAVPDNFISNPTPVIYIGDTERASIEIAPGQPDWQDKANYDYMPWPQGDSRFMGNGRFVLLGGFYLWDLKNQREAVAKDNDIKYHETEIRAHAFRSISHPPRNCIFEKPDGHILAGSKGVLTSLDPDTGEITQSTIDKDLVGISKDGTYLFFLDSALNLWCRDSNREWLIAHDIRAVYPALAGTELYAYNNGGYIVRLNVHGTEYGRTYVPDLWHAIPTERGLAVATPRGPMLLGV